MDVFHKRRYGVDLLFHGKALSHGVLVPVYPGGNFIGKYHRVGFQQSLFRAAGDHLKVKQCEEIRIGKEEGEIFVPVFLIKNLPGKTSVYLDTGFNAGDFLRDFGLGLANIDGHFRVLSLFNPDRV